MTQNRNRQPASPAPVAQQGVAVPHAAGDDGPDLGPQPGAEPLAQVLPEGAVVVMPDELAAMIAQQVADATVHLQQQVRTEVATKVRNANVVPANTYDPPAESTYEPGFMPTPEDWADYAKAVNRDEQVDEPIPYGATIVAISPTGQPLVCTPKAFRALYAGRGYIAHPEDAVKHLAAERRPTRRRGPDALVGASEQAVAQGRRRRRRHDDD